MSATEAKCHACNKAIAMPNRGPANLKGHLTTHPDYQKKFKDMEKAEKTEEETMKQGMSRFVIKRKGELSALDKKIMHHIACTNQPFTVVESETFKALLSSNDRANLKGYHHYSDWVMPRVYAAVKKEVMNCLNACSALSFTSDIWSGPTESFISLTAQGIDCHWKRQKFVLCVRYFPGQHNFETINKVVGKILDDWRIEKQKLHVFLRDEGSNMKKAFEEGGYLHADCGAHKLNLVVSNSLFKTPNIKEMLDSCRKLVGHFNHSTLACDRLREEQESAAFPKHKLLQDVATRWNSTHYMGARLLEQRQSVDLYLTRHRKRNLELKQEEWQLLEKVIKVLEPLEAASKQMCLADEPISVQLPIAKLLHIHIEDLRDPALEKMCETILDLLFTKFDVEEQKIHGLAMFLDPRWKDRMANHKVLLNSNVASWIQEECVKEVDVPASDSEVRSLPSKRKNSFFGKHSNLYRESGGSDVQQTSNAIIEMKSYNKLDCIDPEEDPLEFWKAKEKTYPILAELARRFLSAPATSQPSKQIFSVARDVYDYKRSNLSPDKVEQLIFMNKNLPLLNFEY